MARNNPMNMGIPYVPAEINHLKGTTGTFLAKPAGATHIFVDVEVGTFRLQLGDTNTTIGNTAPNADVTDTGSLKLRVDTQKTIGVSGNGVTVRGAGASDILTYFWG